MHGIGSCGEGRFGRSGGAAAMLGRRRRKSNRLVVWKK
jgi:hypothetical protein